MMRTSDDARTSTSNVSTRTSAASSRLSQYRTPVLLCGKRTALTTALVASVVAFFTLACGGGDDAEGFDGEPIDALKAHVEYASNGQWGRLYDHLYSGQQSLLDENRFVSCMEARPQFPTITSVREIETFDEDIQVPGTSATVATKAVTAEFKASGQTARDTFHYADEGGSWRWFLGDEITACAK